MDSNLPTQDAEREGPRPWGTSARPLGWAAYVCLAGFALFVYGFNLGGFALTEHELPTASGARTMVLTGDWILPRLGPRLWLERPPLSQWLAALAAMLLGGFTEVTVRVPSVLAGVGIVLLVAHLASRWFGRTVGILAGMVQATTFYTLTYARLAEGDIILAVIVVAATVVFVHLQSIAPHDAARVRRRAILLWLLVGLSNVAKAPLLGAGLMLGPALAWLVWRRDWPGCRRLLSPAGIALALVLAAAWPVLALTRAPADVALRSLHHVLRRALGRLAGVEPEAWWYYLSTVPWQLLPWTVAPLFVVRSSVRRAWDDRDSPDRFLWCCALLPVAVFSLFPGKHHHFLISTLPAFSPLAALGLIRCGDLIRARSPAIVRAGIVSLVVLPQAALVIAGVVARRFSPLAVEIWVAGITSAAAALLVVALSIRGRPRAALIALVAATVLISVEYHGWIQPAHDRSRLDRTFLKAVDALVPADAPLVAVGDIEIARHVFYVRSTLQMASMPSDVASRVQGAPTVFVLARGSDRDKFAPLGSVTQISQSEHSRYERTPADRFTLFRIVRR